MRLKDASLIQMEYENLNDVIFDDGFDRLMNAGLDQESATRIHEWRQIAREQIWQCTRKRKHPE